MAKNTNGKQFEFSCDYFNCFEEDSIGIISLKRGIFDLAMDIPLKERLFDKIRQANQLPEIGTMIILGDNSIMGEEEYARYLKSIDESTDAALGIYREGNALTQFIRLVLGLDKLVIAGISGSVVGSFLGAALSVDYRIAANDAVFSFPHIDNEMPPPGSLVYFLPRYLGMANAKKMLLSGGSISAIEACQLGLIDQVVAGDALIERCIAMAKVFSLIPAGTVAMTKRLFGWNLEELEICLKMEAELAAARGSNFQKFRRHFSG